MENDINGINKINEISEKYNYIKDNLEKVLRLYDILKIIFLSNLRHMLVLKGGTCINLFYRDIPRLSVDIDLDYIGSNDKNIMISDKEMIESYLISRLESENYFLSKEKTRKSYALDSLVFKYVNVSGNTDNIKIEINYMDRLHLYSLVEKKCQNKIINDDTDIKMLSENEIYACKVVALLNRAAPRDLFDTYIMIKNKATCHIDTELLRKAIVFYNCISGDIDLFSDRLYDNIFGITQNEVYKYLLPMLIKNEKIDLANMKKVVVEGVSEILRMTTDEKCFIENFHKGLVKSDMLFDNEKIQNIIKEHPMIKYRIGHME